MGRGRFGGSGSGSGRRSKQSEMVVVVLVVEVVRACVRLRENYAMYEARCDGQSHVQISESGCFGGQGGFAIAQ